MAKFKTPTVNAVHWLVYGPDDKFEGATVYAEMAAALVSVLGDGATVRTKTGHAVWREGAEDEPAFDSYDNAALVMMERSNTGEPAPEMPSDTPQDGVDRCE